MKNPYNNKYLFLKAIFVIALVFINIGNLYPIEITFIIGDVKLVRKGKSIKADQGTSVISGDFLSTGKRSSVAVTYTDGSKIELRENTKIKVGDESIKDSDAISVIAGVVNGKFKKLVKGSDTKIYTPTTVCSIRGTEFDMAVSDGADSRIDMKEGRLDVKNPYGKASLKENENADINLSKKPDKNKDRRSPEDWNNNKNEEFNKNPEGSAENFKSYMNKLGDNSLKTSKDISNYDKNLERAAIKGKKGLEKADSEMMDMEGGLTDEMYLNNAAGSSIDGIVNRFREDKRNIYDNFLKIKEESNRVREQQRRNYEALKAVREAYKKAYEEIMQKHKDSMDKIKGSFDKEKYKPQK